MISTADNALAALYSTHFETIRQRYNDILEVTGFAAIVIGAGPLIYRFLDDTSYPFRANPHLLQWLPLQQHPESVLIVRPGHAPRLVIYQPDDFWHKIPEPPGEPWAEHFDWATATSLEAVDAEIAGLKGRTGYLGDSAQWRHTPDKDLCNPPEAIAHLNFYRPFKTDYEIECLRRATARAVPAHRAAELHFRGGGSEFEILQAFLDAARQTENELPYAAIVAKNRNGATLHYQYYERESGSTDSLLIDAACAHLGYASDITRTYSAQDDEFQALIDRLNEAQIELAASVRPGLAYPDLHHQANLAIASVLIDTDLATGSAEALLDNKVTSGFFPHGLGHYLGLQVHEVGGDYADPAGNKLKAPERYPTMRLLRKLEQGQVLTIEPGIYFIDSLLKKLRASKAGKVVKWETVERLHRFGGVRIEDNVLVTADGVENLTRLAFQSAAQRVV